MQIASDPQFEPESDPSDEMLDRLLAQARWPEPTQEALARTQCRCHAIARRHRVMPAIWPVVYAAAAVIALVCGSQIQVLREGLQNSQAVDVPVGIPVNYLYISGNSHSDESMTSRPANLVERLALLQANTIPIAKPASIAQAQANSLVAGERNHESDAPDLSKFLQQVADPNTQEVALSKFKQMPDPPVSPLLDRLTSLSLDERFAAATALATLDDPRVVELLVQRAQRNPGQREALIALGLSESPLAEEALAGMEISSAARAQLLADRTRLRAQSSVLTPRS